MRSIGGKAARKEVATGLPWDRHREAKRIYHRCYCLFQLFTFTEPWARPTEPGLCSPCFGRGLDVIWWLASVIAYACTRVSSLSRFTRSTLSLAQTGNEKRSGIWIWTLVADLRHCKRRHGVQEDKLAPCSLSQLLC